MGIRDHASGAIVGVGARCDALRRLGYRQYNAIMTRLLENLLSRMASWPKEAQAEAVRSMLEIEKKHAPLYKLSDEERAELDEALAECERGEIATDEEVDDFFKKHGARAL